MAQQEARLGMEAELEAYSEKVRAAEAAGIERERSCRVTTVYEETERRVEMNERAQLAAGEDLEIVDPREELTQEDLAAVNLQAYRMAERMKNGPMKPGIARRLAWMVYNGQGISEAVLEVRDEFYAEPGVVQPIKTVDPWDYEVSIEAIVAASVFAACRCLGLPVLFDEVVDHSPLEASQIRTAYQNVNFELGLKTKPMTPRMYIPRFASALDVPDGVRHRAFELAEAIE